MLFKCSQCGRRTDRVVRLDAQASLLVCSPQCAQRALLSVRRVGDYYPNANLSTVYLTRQEFGHQGWIIWHTIAYHYVDHPTESQKRTMLAFLSAFANQYPCARCRSHLLPMLRSHPPRLGSRRDFVHWTWKRHNQVSRRLGKDEYPFRFSAETSIVSDVRSTNATASLFERGAEGNLTERSVSRERFGTAMWMFLHSMAASYQYRQNVTEAHRRWTRLFFRTLQYVYPFDEDRAELVRELRRVDFDRVLSDRRVFMHWVCAFHNRINAKLGKPIYSPKAIRNELEAYACNDNDDE